jgi:hypothetical protein
MEAQTAQYSFFESAGSGDGILLTLAIALITVLPQCELHRPKKCTCPNDRASCKASAVSANQIAILDRHKSVASERYVKPPRESIHRATVGVVAGIIDELIVERDFGRVGDGIAVIGLDDSFEAVVWQCAVADQDAKAAGGEIGLVVGSKTVDDAGNADGVVRPSPGLAGDRETTRDSAIHIGEIPWLDVAVGPAGADKRAHRLSQLLLEIEAYAGAVPACRRDHDPDRSRG